MSRELVLAHAQSLREQRGRAGIEQREIARKEHDPRGVAIAPFDAGFSAIDHHGGSFSPCCGLAWRNARTGWRSGQCAARLTLPAMPPKFRHENAARSTRGEKYCACRVCCRLPKPSNPPFATATRSHGGLHPSHPPCRRPRGDPPGPQAPDADPHDAGPDLRPAHRHGLRRQGGVLLGRQSRRRLAAPLPRCDRERLALPARHRGAFPRRDGQRLRRGRRRPAARRAARLYRRRPAEGQSEHQEHHLPVHRRDARGGAVDPRRTSPSSTRRRPTAPAM